MYGPLCSLNADQNDKCHHQPRKKMNNIINNCARTGLSMTLIDPTNNIYSITFNDSYSKTQFGSKLKTLTLSNSTISTKKLLHIPLDKAAWTTPWSPITHPSPIHLSPIRTETSTIIFSFPGEGGVQWGSITACRACGYSFL